MWNNSKRWTVVYLATWAVGIWASPLAAQHYSITSAVTAAYQADGAPLGTVPNIHSTVAQTYVYRVDLTLHTSGFSGNQRGFGALTFDLTETGLVDPESAFFAAHPSFGPGYNPVNPNVNTGSGFQPLWDDNGYFGSEGLLLAAIAVIEMPHPSDPRPLIGQGAGTLLGSLFVQWDGLNLGTFSINPQQAAYARTDNGKLAFDGAIQLIGSSLVFGVPEPDSIIILCIGFGSLTLATLQRRRAVRLRESYPTN